MENKIINGLFDYAKKDEVNCMSIAYFDISNNTIIKESYSKVQSNIICNNETLYEIGSLTKIFTALVYGILYSKGEIDINSSIKQYIPNNIHTVFENITIRQLLTHTSGLPRLPKSILAKIKSVDNPYASFTKEDLYEYLQSPSEISHRNNYCYSNIGYGILGEVLSILFQKPCEEVIKDKLLIPLKMFETDVITNLKQSDNLVSGFNNSGSKTPYWNNNVFSGAGCFLSNINNMTVFLQSHFDEKINIDFSIETITNIKLSNKMSFGWHIKTGIFSKLLGYNNYCWHSGMTGGFSAYACINKIKKNGLIILTNKPINLDSYFYKFSSYF